MHSNVTFSACNKAPCRGGRAAAKGLQAAARQGLQPRAAARHVVTIKLIFLGDKKSNFSIEVKFSQICGFPQKFGLR